MLLFVSRRQTLSMIMMSEGVHGVCGEPSENRRAARESNTEEAAAAECVDSI